MTSKVEIVLKGHLSEDWKAEFEEFDIISLSDGTTCLTSLLPDQSALLGTLLRLHTLGIEIMLYKKEEIP